MNYGEHPINVPPLHIDELTEDSTAYERVVAAPSDDERVFMWSLWSGVAFASAAVTFTAFFGILSNAKARRSPFNQYLLYLMMPDIVYSFICGIDCLRNAIQGQYVSSVTCYIQSWYAMFGVSGSAYMNAVLAREIHHMLSFGQEFRRYQPPTSIDIAKRSAFALCFAAFVSTWGNWQVPWLPHHTVLVGGIACFPQDFDTSTSLFFYLVFFPFLLAIPMGYVIFLALQIWYKDMIPKRGRRKMLAIFILRLMAVYIVMWTPAMVLVSVFSQFVSPWVEWAGASWGHLQGAVSAAFILTKPDVQQAVKDMFCGRCQFYDQKIRNRRRTASREAAGEEKASRSSSLWLTPSKLRASLSQDELFQFPKNDLESFSNNRDTTSYHHDLTSCDEDPQSTKDTASSEQAVTTINDKGVAIVFDSCESDFNNNMEEVVDDDIDDDDSDRLCTGFVNTEEDDGEANDDLEGIDDRARENL